MPFSLASEHSDLGHKTYGLVAALSPCWLQYSAHIAVHFGALRRLGVLRRKTYLCELKRSSSVFGSISNETRWMKLGALG